MDKLANLIFDLDRWSDKCFKDSVFIKFISLVFNGLQNCSNNQLLRNIVSIFLIISFYILFTSLSLPQFSNDRFGIGIIILTSFLFFLLSIFFNNSNKNITFNIIDLLILVLFITAIISTFNSYFFKESLVGLFKYMLFFIWYLIARISLIKFSEKQLIYLITFLYIICLCTSIYGIYQFLIGVEPLATWEDPNIESTHTRVYSTIGNPNLLAGYILSILPFGFILPLINNHQKILKLFFLFSCIPITACLIFTGSRGGYIGLIVIFIFCIFAMGIYLYKKYNYSKHLIFIFALSFISLLSCLLFFFFPVFTERLATIFTFREDSSNSFRINVWYACLKMLKENWLTGIGPGNSTFNLVYGLYMTSGFDSLGSYNIFLEIAIQIGIIACFIFTFILLISFVKLHKLFWSKGSLLAFGIGLSFVGILTQGLFDTVFFRPQIFIIFWFLLAAIGKLEDITSKG